MKNYLKSLLVLCFLGVSSVAMAFPADPDTTPDAPPAPIDGYTIALLMVGVGIAFWLSTKKTQKI